MKIKKYSNEFKVGLLVIFSILGLLYLTVGTGKMHIKKGGYHIYVVFDEVVGMEKKSPVMLNGVGVGKVDDIKISYDGDKTRVVLKLWIREGVRIRENPVVSIKTLGLMGEKYIQISSLEGRDFIPALATLSGKPYMDLDALMEEAKTAAQGLHEQINKLLVSLNAAVDDNKDEVSRIVSNLESASRNLEEFSMDIKKHPWKLLFKTKEK